jgi:hypothetical protein
MAISAHPLQKAVSAGVKYGLDFAGFEACVAAGLDLERWDNGGYSPRFMVRVIAWHKLHGLVATHIEDARNIAAEKAAKKARKK